MGVLNVTTSEKKIGFLLIEIYRKLLNPQNDGHLDQIWVAFSYIAGFVRITRLREFEVFGTMQEY